MVLETQKAHQLDAEQAHPRLEPIMKDFLGLGKTSGKEAAESQHQHEDPFMGSVLGAAALKVDLEPKGTRYPMFRADSLVDQVLSLRRSFDERNLEGSAETLGLPHVNAGWQGVIPDLSSLDANHKQAPMQLTIFYGGHVNVYNNVSLDRAEAIMHMAAKDDSIPLNMSSSSLGGLHKFSASGFCQPMVASENLCFNAQAGVPYHYAADQVGQNYLPISMQFDCSIPSTPSTATSPEPAVPKALPLARKASLARFLEKRKERMQMMSPYFKRQPVPVQQREHLFCSPSNAASSEFYEQYFKKSI
ncbi:hypothetical protein KP509_18G060000 [Ceratopteris richardii]|uniref:Tify domain-containing protein n=1 Tax=Ceratopteris richardii TaxID=49495 RepID=A0A8T2STA3_CERRI|nr:hypothetical protein KP509_18G060000 [Ceratopteris richardii]